MKIHAFKIIAQSSIDDIEEQIDDLKHFIRKAPETIKTDFYKIADELENDRASLISQYDNLNNIAEDKWDEGVMLFKVNRDLLKDKLDNFLTDK